MLGNFLIGLREGLEASLVLGILIAYLVKTDRRHLVGRIWLGVGAAVALSLVVGGVLTFGTRTLTERTQEAIGGILSITAVALVTWMVFWMAANARTLRGELHAQVDDAIDRGGWALAVVAFLAVAREGLETALFMWSAVRATGGGAGPLLGALLGLVTAMVLGWLIYRGALRMNLATFFTWTGAALIIVAAGVLSYGIHELQEAGLLPGEDDLAFDVTAVIAPDGWPATILRGTVNFSPATSWLQVIAWWAYLIPVMWMFLRRVRTPSALPESSSPPSVAITPPAQAPTGTHDRTSPANASPAHSAISENLG